MPANGPLVKVLSVPPSVACGCDSRSERNNRIGDVVVRAEVNAGRGTRKIDNAEGLPALRHGDALDSPAVHNLVDQSGGCQVGI